MLQQFIVIQLVVNYFEIYPNTHIKAASNFHIRIQRQRKQPLRDNKTVCPRAIDVNRYEIAILYAVWLRVFVFVCVKKNNNK